MLTLHAEGAQVYECKAGADGKLAWAFREPIATLLVDGKTVGRHYAGPNWEHIDGSAVVGKVAGNAPARRANDIPWLKLDVTSRRGTGILSGVTTVQRINTEGGKLDGACDKPGTYRKRALLRGLRVPAQGLNARRHVRGDRSRQAGNRPAARANSCDATCGEFPDDFNCHGHRLFIVGIQPPGVEGWFRLWALCLGMLENAQDDAHVEIPLYRIRPVRRRPGCRR